MSSCSRKPHRRSASVVSLFSPQPVCLRPLQCLIYEAVFSAHVRQHWLWESREALRSWRAVSRVWTASVGSSPRPPPVFFSFTVSLCAYTDLYLHTSTCFFPPELNPALKGCFSWKISIIYWIKKKKKKALMDNLKCFSSFSQIK